MLVNLLLSDIGMVRGIKYRLPVVESVLNWTHGLYRYIEEIFIPELKIAFNEAGYVFKTEEDRYKGLELPSNRVVECIALGSVELEDEDVDVLEEYLKVKESVDKIVKKYFGK
jgi:hypothetical protein